MSTIRTSMLLLAAVAFFLPAAAGVEIGKDAKIVGQWLFMYKGQKRHFEFHKDKTFVGQFAVSGRRFSGTWRLVESKVVLTPNDRKGDWGSVSFIFGDDVELLADGFQMNGHKVRQ